MRTGVLLCFAAISAAAQSTQAYLTGTADDSVSGRRVAGATVSCLGIETSAALPGTTDATGRFTFAALSPGFYRIRIDAPGYQSQELWQLEVPIAARLELRFHLRPLHDVWEARQYQSFLLPESRQVLTFYGPDLDTSRVASFESSHGTLSNLETSVSSVIGSDDLDELPLTGRDTYALLVLLPGVTADTATARGLGFSVNGQRPSSANYLLDGLENNNLSVTGPLGAVAPEGVAEYRISTNNFSAEFGRTSGFLANAISRGGGEQWHGMAYLHLENEVLNANGFQENVHGIRRAPLKQLQPGFHLGGPALRNRLYVSGSLQLTRFRGSNDPKTYALPTAQFIASTSPTSLAGALLRQYPAAVVPSGAGQEALATISAPVQLDEANGLARADYLSGGHRLYARAAVDRQRQPELVYNPYPQFSSPLHVGSLALGAGWTWQIGGAVTQELRAGRTGDAAHYDRLHSEIPILQSGADLQAGGQSYGVSLPGSLSSFAYRNLTANWEPVDNVSWIRGRHSWKFGGGVLARQIHSAFIADRDGLFQFFPDNPFDVASNLNAFAASTPFDVQFAIDNQAAGVRPVPYDRQYRYTQFDVFAQDAFRVTPRLTLNYGIRYDHFGAPLNTGATKDVLLAPGTGSSLPERLETIQVQAARGGGQPLFATDTGNVAPRAGFAYGLRGNTVLRGSYGIFYDRPFDNLWQPISINHQIYQSWGVSGPIASYSPIVAAEQGFPQQTSAFHLPEMFQPGLRNPMIQSAYLGVQQKLATGLALELNAAASRGRRLWTADVVNRIYSIVPPSYFDNPSAVNDPAYGNIDYLANQGSSSYQALTATVRFRGSRLNGQVSYTWSHSIDNQSDPMAGAFANYNTSNAAAKPDDAIRASFTEQFASSAGRGNSDFDQRQNLVFFAIYQLPAPALSRVATSLLRGWRISGLGAVRSGLPYSALYTRDSWTTAGSTTGQLLYPRANIVSSALVYAPTAPDPAGGKTLLNAAAFGPPGPPTAGNAGRNAFAGPGLISADLSLSRKFGLGERRSLSLRAEFYNAFNHANLNNPEEFVNLTGTVRFGQALYGRQEKASGFPLLAPFNEASRVIQLFLRVEF
jgi:Carboxypeptidase regulatory-like domain/TonB-dependent Receptor Plug Domain